MEQEEAKAIPLQRDHVRCYSTRQRESVHTPYGRGKPNLLVRRLLVNNICSVQTEIECQDTTLGIGPSVNLRRDPRDM